VIKGNGGGELGCDEGGDEGWVVLVGLCSSTTRER
jgi:hypothetical protein